MNRASFAPLPDPSRRLSIIIDFIDRPRDKRRAGFRKLRFGVSDFLSAGDTRIFKRVQYSNEFKIDDATAACRSVVVSFSASVTDDVTCSVMRFATKLVSEHRKKKYITNLDTSPFVCIHSFAYSHSL